MAKIVFYCRIKEKYRLHTVEFYKQDIEILQQLGHDVIVCTRYREIPLDFDAIYIWWWSYAAWPVLLSRFLDKSAIVTGVFAFRYPEEINRRDYLHRPFYQRLLIKFALKQATRNVFLNWPEYHGCVNYFRLTNSRCIPLCVHDDYLQGAGDERELSLLNIAWSGKFNLLRKGIPDLLKAIKILKGEGIHVKVYMAGHKGDGYNFLQTMITNLGLQSDIVLLGEISREKKIKYLRRCEIYVQPWHHEGFGLAIAEAMGSGACIITCNVGAVKDVVGDAGIYVKPASEKELAGAIKSMLNQPDIRRMYQIRAYKRARELLLQNYKMEALKKLLHELHIQ